MKSRIKLVILFQLAICFSACQNELNLYEKHTGLKLSEDVREINYDSNLFVDQTYQISFRCNYQTAIEIISKNNMIISEDNLYKFPLVGDEFDWWKHNEIENNCDLIFYRKKNENYYIYFGYNSKDSIGYFLEYTL